MYINVDSFSLPPFRHDLLTWCLKVSHERGAPSRQWVSNQCSLFTYYVSDSPKDKFQNRLFVEQDLRNPSENTKSVTQKLRGRIGARLNAAFIATPTTKQEVMSFLYFEHLLKRYTYEHLEFWYLTKFPVGNKADKSF